MKWFLRLLCPPWCHRADDMSSEAQERLEAMSKQTPEIEKLGAELRRQDRRNNFGPLVEEAIRRSPHRRAHG